ncbi:MAG: hypothetical protein MH825_12520 [Cyanobacteria bacterium]|nr:hypothetical protein [Cyanobacteriota bacterium]
MLRPPSKPAIGAQPPPIGAKPPPIAPGAERPTALVQPLDARGRRPSVARSRRHPQTVRLTGRPPSPWQWLGERAFASAIAVGLIGAVGITLGGGWLGITAIFYPERLSGLLGLLPEQLGGQLPPSDRLLSLADIRSQITLEGEGRLAGDILDLGEGRILIPLFAQTEDCPLRSPCQAILELRTYQTVRAGGDGVVRYRQIARVPVAGPEQSLVLAPLSQADTQVQGSNRPLPLTEIERMERGPDTGVWLTLTGRYETRQLSSLYGTVVHFNRDRAHLEAMVRWGSPQGRLPLWSNVTGDETPELVIDRGVGREPVFDIYQLQPRAFDLNPIALEPLSLTEISLKDGVYGRAIALARGGLWSQAERQLSDLYQRQRGQWPMRAIAQRDFIRYHALVAQARADEAASTPAGAVLASLADGRWQQALERWERLPLGDRGVLMRALQRDFEIYWRRIDAAIVQEPALQTPKIWAALARSAREGRPAAIAWYRQQPNNSSSLDRQVDFALSQAAAALKDPTAIAVGSLN